MAVIPYPFNKEIEVEILSIMLNHPETIPYINKKLTKGMFYLNNNQRLFRALNYCYNIVGSKIDPLILQEKFKEMYSNSTKESAAIVALIIMGGVTSDRIDWYIEKIQEYASRRKLIKTGQITQHMANDMAEDIKDIMIQMQRSIEIVSNVTKTESNLEDDINAMAETVGSKNLTIPFGIPILDTKLAGFMRADITTIGGRTGHGKTTWTIDTAKRQLDLGYKVVIVTNEVKKLLYLEKLALNIAKVNYERVIKFGEITEEEMDRFKKAKQYMIDNYVGKLKIYEFMDSIGEICSTILTDKPDIFYLDWLQRIPLVRNETDPLKWIRIAYGDLAKTVPKTDTAGVIISQLSTRKAQARANKRPELSDFDDSSFIEKASCDCHLIYWYYNENLDQKEYMTVVEMIGAKNRFGQPSVGFLSFHPGYGIYRDSQFIPGEKRTSYMKETGII